MTHIFQIAIEVDDKGIISSVEKNAEAEIIAALKKEVEKKIFTQSYYGGFEGLSGFAGNIVEKIIANEKDEIVRLAARDLADRLARSKAGKAVLDGLAHETQN